MCGWQALLKPQSQPHSSAVWTDVIMFIIWDI